MVGQELSFAAVQPWLVLVTLLSGPGLLLLPFGGTEANQAALCKGKGKC